MKQTLSFYVMAVFYAVIAFAKATVASLNGKLFDYQARFGMVLGANEFNKQEKVAFEDILQGFEDALVLSKNVRIKSFGSDAEAERSGDVIWRPQPYIAQSFDGTDQTANFKSSTQLSVPARLGYEKSSPWLMNSKELRDALQENRLGEAAKQKLASDINVAVMNVCSNQGTLVVKRTTAAAGFDDVAQAEAIFNEQGVQGYDRYMALSTRDYNGMASNLASRATMTGKPVTAYEKAYVGTVSSFETYKLDYAKRLAAAAGGAGITINTLVAGANYYTPRATSVGANGERSNVDNRFQTVTVSSTASVVAGDAFTIATANAVHHVTKGDTGQLKTFRVISVDSATTMTICPPIISAQGGTDAEAQYQNVTIGTPAANSALVWLNTTAGNINPFWQKDAIELMPGRYAVPTDAGTAVMRATTEQGIELVWQKSYDIKTMQTLYRLDTTFGVTNLQPEMSGIMLFSQA